MALTPQRMCQAVLLSAGATVYTASGNGIVCMQIVLANPSSSPVSVMVAMIPSGGSGADSTHALLGNVIVPGNDLEVLDAWQVLNSGDTLHASATTDSVVVLTASGMGL